MPVRARSPSRRANTGTHVGPLIVRGADDQRRGHELPLLQAVVRVHPARPGAGHEIVGLPRPSPDRRGAGLDHAIPDVRRRLAGSSLSQADQPETGKPSAPGS